MAHRWRCTWPRSATAKAWSESGPLGEVVSYRATRRTARGELLRLHPGDICMRRARPAWALSAFRSLARPEATEEEESRLDDVVSDARQQGAVVVAAAGNGGGPVGTPGRHPGVLTVAAGNASGMYCSFASRGPEVELIAPGCDLEAPRRSASMPYAAEGSSHATALAAQDDRGATQLPPESLGRERSKRLSRRMGPVLDVERLFRARGLGLRHRERARIGHRPSAVRRPGGSSGCEGRRWSRFRSPRRCAETREFVRRRCRSVRRRYAIRNGPSVGSGPRTPAGRPSGVPRV